MEKKKIEKAETPKAKQGGKLFIALCGGNLSDGTRFEEGETLVAVSPSDASALIEMGAIKEAE